MTDLSDEDQGRRPQRPPSAPRQWATVTRLGQGPHPAQRPGGAGVPPVEGSLALKEPPGSPHAGPPQTPELRLVGGRSAEEVQLRAARFAQAVVEVLGGDRPLSQLVRWTSPRVYHELEQRLTILTRTSDSGRRMRTIRPQVRSVHVYHPTPVAAEVSVHVRHGQRSRAIAARLELAQGQWRCTELQLG